MENNKKRVRLTAEERKAKIENKIKKLDEQKAQYKLQTREIEKQQIIAADKQRTRRLIQNGALAEKYLEAQEMLPEHFESYLQNITQSYPGIPKLRPTVEISPSAKCTKCSADIDGRVLAYSTQNFGKALCRDCQVTQRDTATNAENAPESHLEE